jgi:Hsp70 protein
MATVAIDFGAARTKLAVYDRRKRRPTIRVEMPTLAYVPPSGPIRVGDAATLAIKADPVGAIHDLKSRLGGTDLVRNRRRCHPTDLIVQLFATLRETALEQPDISDALTDCCLAIPLQFDTRQSESLQEVARLAGFSSVSTVDAPIAAIADHDRDRKVEADHVVVCDLGKKARVAVLKRRDSYWRADQELQPPREWELESIPPRLLLDALEHIAARLAERNVADSPLLLVGGNTQKDGVLDAFKREGWKGEVMLPEHPEFSIALGAIDVFRSCPECGSDQVPLFAVVCPSCGCPSCPECRTIVGFDLPSCRQCGCSLDSGIARRRL